jgi:hypothetical protein
VGPNGFFLPSSPHLFLSHVFFLFYSKFGLFIFFSLHFGVVVVVVMGGKD